MAKIDKNTKQIQLNRGDSFDLAITLKDITGEPYNFLIGDVIKFKITNAHNEKNVVLQKNIIIDEETTTANIYLSSQETKIGDYINTPVDYWYEISLEKNNGDVMTIIGYEDKKPKIFTLNPEASEISDSND